MQVFGLCGSLRKDSYNRMLLHAAASELDTDIEMVTFERLHEIPPYQSGMSTPEAVRELDQLARHSAGLLVATPEYNASIPGALKNALDWISVPFATNPVSGKPAAVIGASTGMFGAVWAQAETRKVLSTLGACVVDSELPVGHADDVLGADGLRDPDLRERLRRVVSTFVTKIREHTSVCAG